MSQPEDKEPLHWIAISAVTVFYIALFGAIGAMVFTDIISWEFWAQRGSDSKIIAVNRSEIFRNLGLIVASIIALFLAGWRSWVANQQSATANKQYALAERGHVTDRFHKGVEMLESGGKIARSAGLRILHDVARDDSREFAQPVLQIICNFTVDRTIQDHKKPNKSVKALISARHPPPVDIATALEVMPRVYAYALMSNNRDEKVIFNLTDLNLSLYILGAVNLSGANLHRAILIRTHVKKANFSNTQITYANMSDAYLVATNFDDSNMQSSNARAVNFNFCTFRNTHFDETNLSGARMHKVVGLTQEQLDFAWVNPGKPVNELSRLDPPLKVDTRVINPDDGS